MAYTQLKDYKTAGKYNYPEDKIDPALKKQKEWYIAVMSAMLNDYTNNRCEIPFDFKSKYDFDTLRLYMLGQQGTQNLKKQMLSEKNMKNGLYKTFIKGDWRVLDILSERIDVIKSQNQRANNEVSAYCSDFDSIKAKDADKNLLKYLMEEQTKEFLERTGFKPDMPVDANALGIKTAADVDNFFDGGQYVMWHELAAIAACNDAKQASGYKGIENRVTDDLICCAIAGVKAFIDEREGMPKFRYANPKYAIIPFSEYYDFRDATRFAELREISIAEVSQIAPHLTAKELCEIAQNFAYLPSNLDIRDKIGFLDPNAIGYGANGNYATDNNSLMRAKVLVMDAQWLSADHETYLKSKDRDTNGNIFKKVKFGYELDKRESKRGDTIEKKTPIKKYEAVWLVGSEVLLQYGQAETFGRIPKLDYYWAKTGSQSLIERCIPHVDDINMAVIKLRNAIATLPPAPRMIIRQSALDGVTLGGQRQTPDDLIQMLIERGVIVISDTDDHGNPIFQNGRAVEFITTNIAEDINVFTAVIREGTARIGEVLGLPQGLDGSNPQQYTGLGKLELAAGASSNALYPTLGRLTDIFEPMFNGIVRMRQALAKRKESTVAFNPLGQRNKTIFKLAGLFTTADFNIKLVVGPTDDQKAQLLAKLAEQGKAYDASNGVMGVSAAEYLMLYDLVMAGNIKLAMFKMAQIQTQRRADAAAKQAADQAWNIKSQTASSRTAEAERRATSVEEERNKQRTAIVTGAETRKNTIIDGYIKAKGENITLAEIQLLMGDAEQDIAAALIPDEEPMPVEGQEMQQGMEQPISNVPAEQPLAVGM